MACETFYGVIKTRLEVENFTGISVEAVRQDFFSTIFLTGLESILTDAAQAKLDAKQNNKHRQIVNRSVSSIVRTVSSTCYAEITKLGISRRGFNRIQVDS